MSLYLSPRFNCTFKLAVLDPHRKINAYRILISMNLLRYSALLAIIFLTGCSTVQERNTLTHDLEVMRFDKKSGKYLSENAKIERVTKKNGDVFLQIKSGIAANRVSSLYSNEHLHYINKHIAISANVKNSFDFGDIHAISNQKKANIHSIWEEERLLAITPCTVGFCDETRSLYYNNDNAIKLRNLIVNFNNDYPQKKPKFVTMTPALNKSILYIYRQNSSPLLNSAPLSLQNSKFELPVNSCYWTQIEPGTYEVKSDWNVLLTGARNSTDSITLEKNGVYFLKYTPKFRHGTAALMLGITYDDKNIKMEAHIVAKNELNDCASLNLN